MLHKLCRETVLTDDWKLLVILVVTGNRPASQRTGLRERRSVTTTGMAEPTVTETWTPEEDLELWQLKYFAERFSWPTAGIELFCDEAVATYETTFSLLITRVLT
jgi:hypothetical protein